MTQPSKRVILLASGSPRRRELLGLLGLPFELTRVEIDESPYPGELARAYTVRLSQKKARAALVAAPPHAVILAADTTVSDEGLILGKPADADEARAMLQRLRGRVHQVYTAITLIDATTGRSLTDVGVTDVPMRPYTDDEIEAYIDTGDPFDKAGGYAIQHTGFRPVAVLRGCYSNVVGLPLCHIFRTLRALEIEPEPGIPLRCQQAHHYDCDVTDAVLAGC